MDRKCVRSQFVLHSEEFEDLLSRFFELCAFLVNKNSPALHISC